MILKFRGFQFIESMKELAINKFHAFVKNKELFGTFIVTVGILIGSVFSYLLQFFMGRMLSIEDFGSFNALLSLSYLVTVPAGVINTSIVKKVSEILGQRDFKRLTSLFWKLLLISFVLGLVFFSLIFLFKSIISQNLKVYNVAAVVWFGVTILLGFVRIVSRAYLQGLLRYKAFSFLNGAGGIIRFVFPALFVWFGFKLTGTFIGLAISGLGVVVLAFLLLKKNLTKFENYRSDGDIKNIVVFSIPVTFMSMGMMLINNVDMLMVKNFFDPKTSGYYAGVVTLGKILLFGAGTVYIIMFPRISSLFSKGGDYLSTFYNFLALQLLLILGGVGVFALFPRLITLLFFGKRFSASIEYLPLFSIFIGLYVFAQFMIMFFMAINKTRISLIFFPVVLLQIVLIYFFHENLYSVIYVNLFVTVLLCLLLVGYFVNFVKNPQKA